MIIIFTVVYSGRESLDGPCNKVSNCKSGLVCYKGRCKVGLGEECEDDDECAGRMVCRENVCKRPKRKRVDVTNRQININTVDSIISSIEDKSRDYEFLELPVRPLMHNTKENRYNHSNVSEMSESAELYVIDICNYSSYTVYLMNDGTFIVMEGDTESSRGSGAAENSRDVKTNLDILRIVNYDGYIYAISGRKLYYLNNNTLDTNMWEWNRVSWSPHDIIDISVPHDKSCIWIQCEHEGRIYDSDGSILEIVDNPFRRCYGVDRTNYISFDNNGDAVVQPGNQTVTNVKDGVIDTNGELYTIHGKDGRYRMMRLVDWKPVYVP